MRLALLSRFSEPTADESLGMHKESPDDPVPQFELEMRRRVWCVLDTWDW